MDAYLEKLNKKYDNWLEKGLISFSSKVVPIGESLDPVKQIIPSQQAIQILTDARIITLARCVCRQRYNNCDKPLEVCFILNETGEKWMEKGLSRQIDRQAAETVLKQANLNGLVHLTLFQPDHEIFALCSCCSCCCHDLQLVLTYGKSHLLTTSDYIARDRPEDCSHCGQCVDRCEFEARQMKAGQMVYNPDLCHGCGLCVTTCPEGAVAMAPV